ncbi:unnamed protein product [Vitrella brassicaformis CCMP3155]|uniref:Uncharacterized protein n=1 Tax=Vitrella brassicaformis (strain CCMP3155) TaxID=1169540 RepID=A0A0G4E8C7_VITBC|nr:unnamed protein product [Vitrella brassicaformis CCMP3155]|eukprot:CEL91684.1 unnamed protein product [Vitrella brassicaformis CCMP3155]
MWLCQAGAMLESRCLPEEDRAPWEGLHGKLTRPPPPQPPPGPFTAARAIADPIQGRGAGFGLEALQLWLQLFVQAFKRRIQDCGNDKTIAPPTYPQRCVRQGHVRPALHHQPEVAAFLPLHLSAKAYSELKSLMQSTRPAVDVSLQAAPPGGFARGGMRAGMRICSLRTDTLGLAQRPAGTIVGPRQGKRDFYASSDEDEKDDN